MQEILKTSIPALIALAGVLIGLIVAYRRWHIERRDSSSADYRRDRRSAHKDLWERVEDVHVRLRAKDLSKAEMKRLIREFTSVRSICCLPPVRPALAIVSGDSGVSTI